VIKPKNNKVDFGEGINLVKNKNVLINDLKNSKKQSIIKSNNVFSPSKSF